MSGKIPQSFITDLISRSDIVALIDRRVSLKKAGKEFKACCPFHNEKTPSFTVSPSKQFYHCFGCGAHGTAISFLMDYEHLSFPEAVEELAKYVGVEVPRVEGPTSRAEDNEDLYEALEQANGFYQLQLRQHPKKQIAVDYLRDRGLSGKTAAQFEIGFAPEGWQSLYEGVAARPKVREALLKVGLIKWGKGATPYDVMRNRIIFPIKDRRGRTIGFGGRTLENDSAKYLNSPESPVFHKGLALYGIDNLIEHLSEIKRVIVVEGYMDVVVLAECGITGAIAALGTAFTSHHFSTIARLSAEIVFCFDGDRAGRQAAWRAVENIFPLFKDGLSIGFVFLPEGEDPDSFTKKYGKEAFIQQLDHSTPLSEFFLQHLSSQANLNTLEGKARFIELARPLLLSAPMESAFKRLLIQKLRNITGVDPQHFGELPPSKATMSPQSWQKKKWATPDSSKTPSPVRTAITLLVHDPALINIIKDHKYLNSSNIPGVQLLHELIELIEARPHVSTAQLIEHWRDTEYGKHLAKLASHELAISKEGIESEFLGAMKAIERQNLEGRMEELLTKSQITELSPAEKQLLRVLCSENQSGI